MHEADDAYLIRSTWSCYWLDQFLTPALNILILSIFYISMDLSTNYFAHFSGYWASFVFPLVFLNEILISAVKFLERLLKPQGLWQKSINQALVAISGFIIVWAASCISNEQRNVHTIGRARWYVAEKEWKIDNVEVKFITFIIQPGWKLASTVYTTLAAEKSALFLLPLYISSLLFIS